jgi:plasmid stabilization system protein ParE
MTPRLLLRPEAKDDVREVFAWYEDRSTGLGFEFLRSLRAALSPVARDPLQFAVVLEDIRRARVRRFPYSVFYVALQDVTSVIAVMHDRRDPRRWQSRR